MVVCQALVSLSPANFNDYSFSLNATTNPEQGTTKKRQKQRIIYNYGYMMYIVKIDKIIQI